MKVSTIVISTVSAISMAGALGIAYAQSTYTEPQPGTSATTSQDPGTMNQAPAGTSSPDSSTMSQDATGTGQDSSRMSQDATGTGQDSSRMSQDATGATTEDSMDSTTPRRSTYNERVARADRN